MTLTLTVRFSRAPRVAQPDPGGRRIPAVSIRHSRVAAVAAPAAPDHAGPDHAGPDQALPASALAAAGAAAHAGGAPARPGGLTGAAALSGLLALAEPAALLAAEAAGLGLLGKVLLATAMRTAQRAIAS